MAGPAMKKGTAPKAAKAKTAKAMVAFRAGERASVSPKKLGPPAPKRPVNKPGKGATVGDAANAVGKFIGEVGANIDRAIPSRKASGIVPGTMKSLPKGGVMGVVKKATRK